jgi:large subunit ribosomal protein L9
MKLILRADVDHLGRLGEIVTVKPGYGRNYLVPKGLAMPATDANMRVFEQERAKLQSKMDAMRAEAMSHGEKIAAAVLTIPMRVGEGDKLYGSVTSAMLADSLKEAIGEEIDRRKIVLDEPIRALGEHKVPVKLHHDVQVELTVKVVRHDAHLLEEEARAEAQTSEPAATEESEAAAEQA